MSYLKGDFDKDWDRCSAPSLQVTILDHAVMTYQSKNFVVWIVAALKSPSFCRRINLKWFTKNVSGP